MGHSKVGDFFMGLLGAWALTFLLAMVLNVLPRSPLHGLIPLLALVAIVVAAARANRLYLVFGIITALIIVPVVLVGVGCALLYTGAWKMS